MGRRGCLGGRVAGVVAAVVVVVAVVVAVVALGLVLVPAPALPLPQLQAGPPLAPPCHPQVWWRQGPLARVRPQLRVVLGLPA